VSDRALRVATWNVHGLRAGVGPVARVVRDEAPDVLLVQESGPRGRLRALGAAVGMTAAVDPRAFPRRRVQDAVLVRPPLGLSSHRLVRFGAGSLLFPRGAMIARAEGITAISVHLGLDGPERGRHVPQLLALLDSAGDRFAAGGDLNATPDARATRAVASRATDCWDAAGQGEGGTFPSHAPTARIDYLFVGPAVQALRAWTAGGTVSDPLMVVADVRVRT
jgi:endonuclease/exonuclease/phosphatase family metal-dependent hydrolase